MMAPVFQSPGWGQELEAQMPTELGLRDKLPEQGIARKSARRGR